MAWLRQRKILLPGVTRLTRLVTTVRAEAAERLWRALVDGTDHALRQRSWHLLEVEEGSRFSALERLRASPTRLSGQEQERSPGAPGGGQSDRRRRRGRLLRASEQGGRPGALWPRDEGPGPAGPERAPPQRRAGGNAKRLEQEALDDALDLFDILMATKLLAGAERESAREQLHALPVSPPPRPSWPPPSGCCSRRSTRQGSCPWPRSGR